MRGSPLESVQAGVGEDALMARIRQAGQGAMATEFDSNLGQAIRAAVVVTEYADLRLT